MVNVDWVLLPFCERMTVYTIRVTMHIHDHKVLAVCVHRRIPVISYCEKKGITKETTEGKTSKKERQNFNERRSS